MVVPITFKSEEDSIKNEGTTVLTRLYVDFSDTQVSGGIRLKFELIQAFMVILVTCKNEEDPIKTVQVLQCFQHFSHYKCIGIFSDTQGQLTPQSVVKSGRILNTSEILWLSLLPIRMEKI